MPFCLGICRGLPFDPELILLPLIVGCRFLSGCLLIVLGAIVLSSVDGNSDGLVAGVVYVRKSFSLVDPARFFVLCRIELLMSSLNLASF